jgi:prephenate dehydrogenase
MFTDPYEADGLLAYSHTLPHLVAAALVNTTIDQPGWREARKLAGRDYALATEPVGRGEENKNLGQLALLNSENTVRIINLLIDELLQIRDAIATQDAEGLKKRLEHAQKGREQWLQERSAHDWEKKTTSNVSIPTSGEVIGRLFTGRMFGSSKRDKDQK